MIETKTEVCLNIIALLYMKNTKEQMGNNLYKMSRYLYYFQNLTNTKNKYDNDGKGKYHLIFRNVLRRAPFFK